MPDFKRFGMIAILLSASACAKNAVPPETPGDTAHSAAPAYASASDGATSSAQADLGRPVTVADFEKMKKSVLFDDNDVKYLRMSYDVLKDQTDAVLDVWYGFVASQPQLLYYFSKKTDGKPDAAYLAAVRKRFGQWILDTASANYDQKWLDYQYEIGLRHHRAKKNKTDNVQSVDIINYRYIPLLSYPITATLKPFLAKKGHSAADVDKMQQAWIKSVLLQVTLWSEPYIKSGDF